MDPALRSNTPVDPNGVFYSCFPLADRHDIRLLSFVRTQDPNIQPTTSTDESPLALLLQTTQLDNAPDYSALSWPLGVGTTATFESVTINGKPFRVASNLATALRNIRSRAQVQSLWVGAICINESDVSEKNNQVDLMRDIYPRAAEVFMWLPMEKSPEARRGLRTFQMLSKSCCRVTFQCQGNPPSPDWLLRAFGDDVDRHFRADDLDWQALAALFLVPAWTCLWTVQGVLLGKSAIVLCGEDESFEMIELNLLIAAFSNVLVSTCVTRGPVPRKVWNAHVARARAQRTLCLSFSPYLMLKDAVAMLSEVPYPLEHLIRHSELLQAADPRNKIYALLGFLPVTGRANLEVDYGIPRATVFFKTAIHVMIRTGNYGFIGGTGGCYHATKDSDTTCGPAQWSPGGPRGPSWVSNCCTAAELTPPVHPFVTRLDPAGICVASPYYDATFSLNPGPAGFITTIPVVALSRVRLFNASSGRPSTMWKLVPRPESGDTPQSLQTRGFICDKVVGTETMFMSAKSHLTTLSMCLQLAKRFRPEAEDEADPIIGAHPPGTAWWRRFFSAFCLDKPRHKRTNEYMAIRAIHFILMLEMLDDERAHGWKRSNARPFPAKFGTNWHMDDLKEEVAHLRNLVDLWKRQKTGPYGSHHGSVFAEIVFGGKYVREPRNIYSNEPRAMARLCNGEVLSWMEKQNNIEMYYADYAAFLCSLNTRFSYRDFFVTKEGYMGRGRKGVKKGDLVCIIFGCNLPLIARRHEEGGLEMIGEAFIEGMLEGEMLERLGIDFEAEDFVFI